MRKVVKQRPTRRDLINRGYYLKGAALGTLGFCTRSAVDIEGHGREWVEVVDIDLKLRKRHRRLHGTRIAHISDLHHSRTVTTDYLRRCIERLNQLEVDIVLLTGDYITYDIRGKYRKEVVALLGRIQTRFGAYACLGNHDYGFNAMPARRRDYLLIHLIRGMRANGITLLRNESKLLNINGHPLRLVGLGDLSVGDFHPQKAFDDTNAEHPTIALVHNPRCVEYLDAFGVDIVVSGHTHGRQSRFPPDHILNTKSRRFHAGMYDVDGTSLYVNRGLGRIGRMRFYSRPEITILTLR